MAAANWEQFRGSRAQLDGDFVVADSTFSATPEARKIFAHDEHDRVVKAPRRKRMSVEERRTQIVHAAAKVIATKGFWGMSLQDIADEIGITEAALYHYINTKNDLLGMIIEELYDSSEANTYIYGNAKATDFDGHEVFYFPRFCLDNVLFNIKRPEMVKLFSILNAEALSPEHPAHEYFINRHQKFWKQISAMHWMLPEPYRTDINRFHHLWTLSMSAMDGLQLRWLADSSADMTEEWLAFSEELFPDATWNGFTDPSEYDPSSRVCLVHD
jgi:AcrR family transcriptional regulator